MSKKVNAGEIVSELYRWQEQSENRVFLCIAGDLNNRTVNMGSAGGAALLGSLTFVSILEDEDLKAVMKFISSLFVRCERNGLNEEIMDKVYGERAEMLIRQVLKEEGESNREEQNL